MTIDLHFLWRMPHVKLFGFLRWSRDTPVRGVFPVTFSFGFRMGHCQFKFSGRIVDMLEADSVDFVVCS